MPANRVFCLELKNEKPAAWTYITKTHIDKELKSWHVGITKINGILILMEYLQCILELVAMSKMVHETQSIC